MARTHAYVWKPSTVDVVRHLSDLNVMWIAFVLISLLNAPATGYLFRPYHHSGSQPIQYLRVIRHRHPHYHHSASGHHPSRIRLHPTLHGHIHYEDDYPHHSGTHYHGYRNPEHSGTHYHTRHKPHSGTLYGYQLQGVAQQEPAYQPQQSGAYYDGQNYYMDAPQGNGVQYSEQPQPAGAQHVQPQQSYEQPSGVQPQAAGPYDQLNAVVKTGGSDYGGSAQNYGFHCKYSYGPYGKLEKCKSDPPLPSPQFGTGGLQNPAATSSQYQEQEGAAKNANPPIETYNNKENYVYVPAPWD